jgi:ABC-2 type transport system permease protein
VNATGKMLWVETKLVTRDVGNLIFGLFFPAILLLVLGALPGFTDRDPDLGGLSLIELYTPIVLVLTFAMVGVSSLAAFLTTYRKEGVLRRLRVTPVGPSRLLVAQFVANLVLALVGSTLALIAAIVVFDIGGPQDWFGFIVALMLAAAALFAIGLLVGSLAGSPSAASAIAPLVWLPLMVLGGLWFPREAMPDTMRLISDYSPAGAAVDAVQQAWFSGVTQVSSLLVMAVTVVVVGSTAAKVFRWE